MRKFKLGLIWAAALLLPGCFTACQNEEDLVMQDDDETVELNVVAHVSVDFDNESRTSYTPTETSFDFAWSKGDQVIVVSEDGRRNLGVMTLKGDGGTSYADFSGTIRARTTDKKVNVYYLGRKTTDNLGSKYVNMVYDLSNQETSLANITDYGVMHSLADLQRDADNNAIMQFSVKSLMSYARFSFHFIPENVVATNEAVSVKGSHIYNGYKLGFAGAAMTEQNEGAISMVPDWSNKAGGDACMVFVPATAAVTEFEVTVGGVLYKASLDAKDYMGGKYYCGGQPLHGKDVYFSKDGDWTLIYDANGGSNAPATATVNGNFAQSYRFTVSTEIPVKEGYEFLGWADSDAAATPDYQVGGQVTIARPATTKTIYAVWKQKLAEGNITVPGSTGTDY